MRPAAIVCALLLCGGCGESPRAIRLEWPAMGTVAAVQVRGFRSQADAAEIRDTVRRVFAGVEKLLDAHDPDSELSRLARLDDAGVVASCAPLVRPCYEAAFAFERETQGRFSPRWRGKGTLDLGAIAKGFAADLAAEAAAKSAAAARCEGILVDLGGNLKAAKGEWKIAIYGSSPRKTATLAENAAAATSAAYYRGGHIADAKSGKTVEREERSVTVLLPPGGRSAMDADALSTVCFILGAQESATFLSATRPDAQAIWVEK